MFGKSSKLSEVVFYEFDVWEFVLILVMCEVILFFFGL